MVFVNGLFVCLFFFIVDDSHCNYFS